MWIKLWVLIDGVYQLKEELHHDQTTTAASFVRSDHLVTSSHDGKLRYWKVKSSNIQSSALEYISDIKVKQGFINPDSIQLDVKNYHSSKVFNWNYGTAGAFMLTSGGGLTFWDITNDKEDWIPKNLIGHSGGVQIHSS